MAYKHDITPLQKCFEQRVGVTIGTPTHRSRKRWGLHTHSPSKWRRLGCPLFGNPTFTCKQAIKLGRVGNAFLPTILSVIFFAGGRLALALF